MAVTKNFTIPVFYHIVQKKLCQVAAQCKLPISFDLYKMSDKVSKKAVKSEHTCCVHHQKKLTYLLIPHKKDKFVVMLRSNLC
jgi:hypothetical protein